MDQLNRNLCWAIVSDNVQKLLELIVGFEVIQKFAFALRGELNISHHNELFTADVGIEVVEALRESFEYFWITFSELNSNRFHVIR